MDTLYKAGWVIIIGCCAAVAVNETIKYFNQQK